MDSNLNATGSVNVLLTVPWHATRSACKDAWVLGFPRYVIEGDRIVRDGVCGAERKSRNRFSEFLAFSNIYKAIVLSGSVAVDKDFELYLRLVEEMYKRSQANNQKFIVAFIRADKNYFSRSKYTNEKLFSALSKSSDAILDVTLADTAEAVDPSFLIHTLDPHPSAKANAARAKAIIELFTLNRFVP